MSDGLTEAAKAAAMTDDELVAAWTAGSGHERLTAFQKAVIDEMQRRDVQF